MHSFPGDAPRSQKIAMLERSDQRGSRKWKRNYVLSRERAVIKDRLRKEPRHDSC